MTHCLEDKALFLLSEGETSEEHRSHLQSCQRCRQRYREIERDLRLITQTLQQEPPLISATASKAPVFSRFLPIAAGVLLAIAFLWGERAFWRPDASLEQRFSGDVSQFLEQVSEAIFDGRSAGEIDPPTSDSDLASVQVALGADCADACRGLFNESTVVNTKSKVRTIERPVIAGGRRPIDPAMQRMVSDRAE